MEPAAALRQARIGAGLSLRELARRAGTSHATLIAYERGHKSPSFDTFDRILRAAGCAAELQVAPAVGGADRAARGRELLDALELAAHFPARHAPKLAFPQFGRT